MKRLVLSALLACICPAGIAVAQTWDSLCIERQRIDTATVGLLRAEVNALAFFQNNEYSSPQTRGYTLPGAWLQPRLALAPLPQLQIEAGVHLMLFDGVNRYPNYAYHDIVQWKGNQHQHGVHALPFLRVQADFRHLSIVVGNIYGGQNHDLVLPLYHPEQNLSADPETGFQLLLNRRRSHMDVWLNWQSFIFNLDSHQEAFTVGMNYTQQWGGGERLRWETPVQLLIQHRGGEIDTTDCGVQTLCNASAGVRMTWQPGGAPRVLSSLRAEANVLGSYQQSGRLWPFTTGFAVHAALRATLWRRLGGEVGYVGIPRQYANLFGSPFFSTISIRHAGLTFRGMHTAYASLSYTHTFARDYHLGAQLDLYSPHAPGVDALPYGFGLYFRVHPSFGLGRGR